LAGSLFLVLEEGCDGEAELFEHPANTSVKTARLSKDFRMNTPFELLTFDADAEIAE
jgi:hypothetical protein